MDLAVPEFEPARYDLVRAELDKKVFLSGRFRCRVRDRDGRLVDEFVVRNAATNAGLDYMGNAAFVAGSQITTWYAGLINGSGFSGVSPSDTMGSHPGWTELQAYNEAVRQTWTAARIAAGQFANTAVMSFTNGGATASVQGLFITSVNTKGGTTGTLWATAPEGSPRTLAAAAVLQVIYECDLTATG